ncbi:MAG: hypothetical protein AB1635_20670, partial [Acidobacteriota bacterium]
DDVPDDRPSESVHGLYPALVAREPGSVRVHASEAAFFDIGTPADYLATALALAAREGRPPDRGARTRVDPSARVERSLLWDDVEVGAGAELVDCIVADRVIVPPGARHRGVVLLPNEAPWTL